MVVGGGASSELQPPGNVTSGNSSEAVTSSSAGAGSMAKTAVAAAAEAAQRSALGQWMDWFGLQIACGPPSASRPERLPSGLSIATPRHKKQAGKASRRQNAPGQGALVAALRNRGGARPPKVPKATVAAAPADESAYENSAAPPARKVPQLQLSKTVAEEPAPSSFAALTREFLARGTPRGPPAGLQSARSPTSATSSPNRRASSSRASAKPSESPQAVATHLELAPTSAPASTPETLPKMSNRLSRSSADLAKRSSINRAARESMASSGRPAMHTFSNWLGGREPLLRFDHRSWDFPASNAEKREMLLLTVMAEERARRAEISAGLHREQRLLQELGCDCYSEFCWEESASEFPSEEENEPIPAVHN